MSNAFLHRRRPVAFYGLVIVLGLVTCVVAGLVTKAAVTPHGPKDYRVPAAVPPVGSVTGVEGNSEPGRPLQILPGTRRVNEVSVGYPHSTVGAVSAAVQYWGQIASTLDPARASRIAAAVADPAWSNAVAELSQGPIKTRKGLGLRAGGPVPDGASVLLTPVAYQVRQVTADSVTVLLLGYYQITLPGMDPQNRVGVYPLQVRWAAGDWKIPASTLSADYSDLQATPGSAEASALGWHPLSSS
jgi:hypothetical protein